METPKTTARRSVALDALRGFTIIAMIIVNDPGSWDHVFPPLLHADWNGVTPTDYIFPFFLFIVGVSIVLAYDKRMAEGADRQALLKKAVGRALKIYGVGLFLWLFPGFDFTSIRWVGVLQRIAFVFLPCALLYLYTDWRTWLRVGVSLLVGYWVVMAFLPVPGIGTPDLSAPMKNWAHYLDGILLPGYLWQKTWDPEGLLSTLPSIATGISGMLAGRLMLAVEDPYRKVAWLSCAGFLLFALGGVWSWFFPYNKPIWSSSYVLHTSGLAMMALGASYLLVDVKGYTRWTRPGLIFGANAITAYVLASLLTAVFYNNFGDFPGLNAVWVEGLSGAGLDPRLASLLYALLYVCIVFVPVYFLYKKRIFIKL